jgi:hypothetical protein
MKNKITKILFAISILAAPLAARASLLLYDNFQYSNGPVIVNSITPPATGPAGTNSLWIRDSGAGTPSDLFCVGSNLQVTATGGSLISRQDDCFRLLVQTNWALANAGLPGGSGNYGSYTNNLSQPVQPIYASFTVICESSITNFPNTNNVVNAQSNVINGVGLPNGQGTYFASFYNTFYGYCGRVQAFTNGTVLPNTWRIGVTDNVLATNAADGGWPHGGGMDLAVNTPYQVVEEFDPINNKAATIWVNPININQTGFSPVDPKYTANDLANSAITNALNAFAFRQASTFGNAAFLITNLAVATSFAEAMTNIWGTNAQPPVVVYQPVGFTNFIGNPISLSAVANGQGLANLKYQWQQGGTNYTGGDAGANNNLLTVSTAQASDSGDFTLVVTTPYGLSTTSAVAHVFISSAAVPPAFVTEPVKQTVYNGQSVTFSTSVLSPDINNIYFQWYSNNVAVAGANSSTFTLNNVSTNISGSIFSVAATNDVTPVGIVSTNAVLTVLSAQTVSIAYLRSLVNLTTFAPTNSPPSIPYTVTGTVTTYTNLTTGNTSSYYLQDGTAGINIFVTQNGAPLFRPQQGDVVTFIGVMSSFTTGLELSADVTSSTIYPYTSFFDTGTTNALPAPIVIPYNVTNIVGFAYMNTNLAGSLVQLTNVYFGTNAGLVLSTSVNNTVIVTNSGGLKFTLTFFDLDLDTAGKTLPTNAVSVTGVLYGFQPTFSVGVTRWADIVTNPAVIIPTQPAHITSLSLVNTNVVINATNGQSGGAYYLLANTNVAKPLSQWTTVATNVVTATGATAAFTFIGTNVASPGAGQQFYILSNTNSNHP